VLTRLAPAKINLVLEVLGRRQDGYHEIRSLVQTVDLYDRLSFDLADDISLECTEPEMLTPDNLVLRAARLVKQAGGCEKGARIRLEKQVPWGAGLGGGSSDAAITLLALNELWGLKLKTADLVELAARLGSDVPFFIYGGTALVEGRGERVTPVSPCLRGWFVLMEPPLPGMANKTQRLYSKLDHRHFTDGQHVSRALEALSLDGHIGPSLLFNVFDCVASGAFAGLEKYWRCFEAGGASNIHLAGSGPVLLASAASYAEGEGLHRRLIERGLTSYCVSAGYPSGR